MSHEGFAIRCPHCFEWSRWENGHPKDHAIDTDGKEWAEILEAVRGQVGSFRHPKLLTCQHSGVDCPMPFRAVVVADSLVAHKMVAQVPSWGPQRAFRLWKSDLTERWSGFSAVLFTLGSVPRLKDIELEAVLDRHLLARTIHGIGAEINAPFTVYVAEVFRTDSPDRPELVYWSPVEGYSQERWEPVPPKYNPLCELCRNQVMTALRDEMETQLSPQQCPAGLGDRNGGCGGRDAACLRQDWNRCPAFLNRRLQVDPCYKSDIAAIEQVEREWSQRKSREEWPTHQCWAGFTELAVPIIIHDHLVAVAMSGQLMPPGTNVATAETVMKEAPLLVACRGQVEKALGVLATSAGDKELTGGEPAWDPTPYRLTEARQSELTKGIAANVKQIETAGNARYLYLRERYEMAFREELVGRLHRVLVRTGSERAGRLAIVERLREYWAFMAAYLMVWDPANGELRLIARALQGKAAVLRDDGGALLGRIGAEFAQSHPLPWSREFPADPPPPNAWIRGFHAVCDAADSMAEVGMPRGGTSFFVAFPTRERVYILGLCDRDTTAVSPMRKAKNGGISPFAREYILSTATEAVRLVDGFVQTIRHKQTLRGFVMALTKALEMNDPYTAGHSQEVAGISRILAQKLGMPTEDQETAWLAGMVHDIGKLVIDPAVLTKTARLNHIETIMMESHPDTGGTILEKVGGLVDLGRAVREHHERYTKAQQATDTHAYPGRVTGDDLDRFARLIAVADTYSAITSDRPYRPGRSHDEALAVIVSERGRQFHPAAVDAFVQADEAGLIRMSKATTGHRQPPPVEPGSHTQFPTDGGCANACHATTTSEGSGSR